MQIIKEMREVELGILMEEENKWLYVRQHEKTAYTVREEEEEKRFFFLFAHFFIVFFCAKPLEKK